MRRFALTMMVMGLGACVGDIEPGPQADNPGTTATTPTVDPTSVVDNDPGDHDGADDMATMSDALKAMTAPLLDYHFSEKSGSNVFGDSAVTVANAVCAASTCPTVVRGLVGGSKKIERAVTFDGVNDCLSMGNQPVASLKAPFTLSAFIAPHDLPVGKGVMAIAAKYGTKSQAEWIFGLRPVSRTTTKKGDAVLGLWRSSDGVNSEVATSTTHFPLSWLQRMTHVAVTVDALGNYRFFVNGVEGGTGTFSAPTFFAGKASATIGCTDGYGLNFNGTLDEFALYPSALLGKDIAAIYNSYITSPVVAYTQNPPLVKGEVTLDSLGREITKIDTVKLAQVMKDLNMDFYEFPLRRSPQNDLAQLEEFLETTKGDARYKVKAGLPAWWNAHPYGNDYVAWMTALAQLSAKYPNLIGVNFDDFLSERADDGAYSVKGMGSFLSAPLLKAVCAAKKQYNPNLKLSGVVYCGYTGDNSVFTQYNGLSNEDTFIAYTKSDPALTECMDGVFLYMGPDQWTGAVGLDNCVDTMRAGRPDVEITEGIYITRLDKYDISLAQRLINIDEARLTRPDNFVFYTLPISPVFATETVAEIAELYTYTQSLSVDRFGFLRW